MDVNIKKRSKDLLQNLKLVSVSDPIDVQSLTGGVSSDIACVKTLNGEYCTKFALAKLNVDAVWEAPIHRNAAEYAWLEFVSSILPENVPKLFGRSQTLNGFVMEYLNGDDIRLWKSDIFDNGPKEEDVKRVAQALAEIHIKSSKPDFDDLAFQNMEDFHSLRLEPYFLALVERHPILQEKISSVVSSLMETKLTLIHGDVSPKNILFKSGIPIFLDAECATMGDPAFDVGFCLNHLYLKAIHVPDYRDRLLASVKLFWKIYRDNVSWEDPNVFEARLMSLLPLLLLARVDGKSPVEYLTDVSPDKIRSFAVPNIQDTHHLFDAYHNLFCELTWP